MQATTASGACDARTSVCCHRYHSRAAFNVQDVAAWKDFDLEGAVSRGGTHLHSQPHIIALPSPRSRAMFLNKWGIQRRWQTTRRLWECSAPRFENESVDSSGA